MSFNFRSPSPLVVAALVSAGLAPDTLRCQRAIKLSAATISREIVVRKRVTIADTTPGFPGYPWTVDRGGRFFVPLRKEGAVLLFDKNGKYLTRFGRLGN